MSNVYELIREAREAGVLRTWTPEEVQRWQRECGAFRDRLAAERLTGGAFVVGESAAGVVPLVCARGNSTTLGAAIAGLVAAWCAQRRIEGKPVGMPDVADLIANAWALEAR
jgi:hypothetical protein